MTGCPPGPSPRAGGPHHAPRDSAPRAPPRPPPRGTTTTLTTTTEALTTLTLGCCGPPCCPPPPRPAPAAAPPQPGRPRPPGRLLPPLLSAGPRGLPSTGENIFVILKYFYHSHNSSRRWCPWSARRAWWSCSPSPAPSHSLHPPTPPSMPSLRAHLK